MGAAPGVPAVFTRSFSRLPTGAGEKDFPEPAVWAGAGGPVRLSCGCCLRRTCGGHTPEGPLDRLPSPRLHKIASSLIYSGDHESGVRETYRARLFEYL